MPPPRAKKAVKFAPDTNFERGRDVQLYLRSSESYVSGKHACPSSMDGWMDTSFMSDTLEHLLNLRVYKTFLVSGDDEVYALYDHITAMTAAGASISSLPGPALREHRLYQDVLTVYVRYREGGGGCDGMYDEEGLEHAKGLVLYQSFEGKLLGFQFVIDEGEDAEADEYVLELKNSIPDANQAEL